MVSPKPRGTRALFVLSLFAGALAAQAAPSERSLPVPGVEPLRWSCAAPPDARADRWLPVCVLFADGAEASDAVAAAMAGPGAALVRAGWLVAAPIGAGREAAVPQLLTHLRQNWRIEGGGVHLLGHGAGARAACAVAMAAAPEVRSLVLSGLPTLPAGPWARLRGRNLAWFGPAEALAALPQAAGVHAAAVPSPAEAGAQSTAVVAWLEQARAALRLPGAAGEVAAALDDFHDAAAKGDEERYFALLPDDAVFLGTDASERWTGTAFRAFAMPYFQRGPAWTYVPVVRHVELAGDAVAFFDEVLDNDAYGECRGSGVLQRRDGRWVLRQYNLTIPVPNDLARGLVARARALAEGGPLRPTVVVCVRHAEKVDDSKDPELSEAGRLRAEMLAQALRSLPVAAAYATQFRRTQATVAPVCKAFGLEPVIVPGTDSKPLARRLRTEHTGQVVVVAGHSNTIPVLLHELGVKGVTIADDAFDGLFVVTIDADGAHCLPLHYGARTGG